MPNIPIACTLTYSEQAERQWVLQQEIGSAVEERVELEDGYALRFPSSPNWISRLAELVVFERSCCPYSSGTTIEEKPWGTREFPALDLERNLLTFYERISRA